MRRGQRESGRERRPGAGAVSGACLGLIHPTPPPPLRQGCMCTGKLIVLLQISSIVPGLTVRPAENRPERIVFRFLRVYSREMFCCVFLRRNTLLRFHPTTFSFQCPPESMSISHSQQKFHLRLKLNKSLKVCLNKEEERSNELVNLNLLFCRKVGKKK